MATEEPECINTFRKWLKDNGAYIDPHVYFARGEYGMSIYSHEDLEENSTVVSCPFDIMITPKTSKDSLRKLAEWKGVSSGKIDAVKDLDDGLAVCTYLVLHFKGDGSSSISDSKAISSILKHDAYIATLPTDLITPLYYNEKEVRLLLGTNLYQVVIDRRQEWINLWKKAHNWLSTVFENKAWENGFTWERFLRSKTWLSSRAFPSSILHEPPSLTDPSAEPILVPLLDSLNHSRATPVSWSVNRPQNVGNNGTVKQPSVSLVSHLPIKRGEEVFNNYGPKSNDELLLGYGFVIENNPEDTMLLKLPGDERRFRIGRKATGEVTNVWNEIGRRLQESFASDGDDLDIMMAELELEIAQVLPEMLHNLKNKLPLLGPQEVTEPVRNEILQMVRGYVKGKCISWLGFLLTHQN
ncbi:SET domain-containing protein [Serendipita vermifera]|nr:SET domain-containing protein [Serendipita vermifera]